MDNKSNLAQLRYLEEVAVNLRRNAFEVERIEDQHLPVSWNGSHLCRISGKGSVLYRQEIVDALGAQAELDQVVDIANITREYMTMMEYAPLLKAQSLNGDYRILADFNTSVLAGHPTEHGVQFVVWDWDFDKKGVSRGGYYQECYEAAKRDFVTRSGLLQKDALFEPEQLKEMYHALNFVREQDDSLTFGRDQELRELMEQIRRLSPEAAKPAQEPAMEQTM